MLDDLADPNPPEPTAAVRQAVSRRARTLVHRRRGAAVGGGVAALALVLAGSVAMLGGGGSAQEAPTEVAGVQTSNPTASTTTTATLPPEPVPPTRVDAPAPAAAETPPPPPAAASVAGEVVVPAGFTITGCTLNGAPLPLSGTTFALSDLAPGQSIEVVCEAQSGDGAARAARVVVDLQPGSNTVRVVL